MAQQYDNTNKGIIAKNDRKEAENHPDITGTINIEGTDYFINGWHKKRKSDGAPFYSLSVKRKAERVEEIRTSYDQDDDADTIPF